MSNEFEVYNDHLEEKRREISEFAFEQYKRDGKLSGRDVLRESNALDEVVNKRLLEARLLRYRENIIP